METPYKHCYHTTEKNTQDEHPEHPLNSEQEKKNSLLTPLLLSIPVMIILFILLSGSFSGFSDSVESESIPLNMRVEVPEVTNVTVQQTDSSLNSSKTLLVPAQK